MWAGVRMVSIIIPTYNEESTIGAQLARLVCLEGCEVIVADGSSADRTAEMAARWCRVVATERNRGQQLNAGAAVASGEALLFLHADARLPAEAPQAIHEALGDPRMVGGNFCVIFSGDSLASRAFTLINHWRRWFGIYYGDSGIFVRREVFVELGGFRPMPIMDDYEFVRRLERRGRTVCLRPPLVVSARRWEEQGAWLAMLSWFVIQSLYYLGVPPSWLAALYAPVRAEREGCVPRLTRAEE